MTGVQYLTDREGRPQAVVLAIKLWRRLLPREDATPEELTEAVEDYCLGKAMDDRRRTPLLSREAPSFNLFYLTSDDVNRERGGFRSDIG